MEFQFYDLVDSAAATMAGFNVLRLINECSSAALAYDLGQLDNTETLWVDWKSWICD